MFWQALKKFKCNALGKAYFTIIFYQKHSTAFETDISN